MIHLFLHQPILPTSSFDQLLKLLPVNIQNRILRKKQQKKRVISLLGYVMLHKVLTQRFALNLDKLEYQSSGKPILNLPNQKLSFNISHHQHLVGLVLGEADALGLDIEAFRKFEKVESSFSFFSPVEQNAIIEAHDSDWKLIELWSKKEALVKAVGGRMFDMAAYTDVRFATTTWEGKTYYFTRIEYPFEGFIWVASSLIDCNISVKNIEDLSEF